MRRNWRKLARRASEKSSASWRRRCSDTAKARVKQRQGLGEAMLGQPEQGEVVERAGDVGMVLAEGRFPDGERALVERLGPAVQPLVRVEAGEVVERVGDVGMVLAEGRFLDGERALVERLGPARTTPGPSRGWRGC